MTELLVWWQSNGNLNNFASPDRIPLNCKCKAVGIPLKFGKETLNLLVTPSMYIWFHNFERRRQEKLCTPLNFKKVLFRIVEKLFSLQRTIFQFLSILCFFIIWPKICILTLLTYLWQIWSLDRFKNQYFKTMYCFIMEYLILFGD